MCAQTFTPKQHVDNIKNTFKAEDKNFFTSMIPLWRDIGKSVFFLFDLIFIPPSWCSKWVANWKCLSNYCWCSEIQGAHLYQSTHKHSICLLSQARYRHKFVIFSFAYEYWCCFFYLFQRIRWAQKLKLFLSFKT